MDMLLDNHKKIVFILGIGKLEEIYMEEYIRKIYVE